MKESDGAREMGKPSESVKSEAPRYLLFQPFASFATVVPAEGCCYISSRPMASAALSIPEDFNVAQYFVDRNLDEGRGDDVAILYHDQKLTYRHVADRVSSAANAFRDLGLKKGERVFLLLLDSPAFITAFWGAIKMGAVPVPVNTMLGSADYEFMLRDSGARCLVVEESLFDKAAPGLGSLPELKTVWVAGQAKTGCPSFEEALGKHSPQAASAPTHRDDPAFWLYTSGSTGHPKAAIHLQHDMVYCLELYARRVLEMNSDDLVYSTSKLFFAYGLGNSLYFPFGVGARTILVLERPSAEVALETLRRLRPTIFFAVPSVYAALLRSAEARQDDFGSLRRAVSAGEALPAPLSGRFRERFGISILDGIGSTEMLHMFISNRPDDIAPGSSGRLVPGYEARIVDERENDLPPGETGELWIRGESAAAGYWNHPEHTRATFRGEWTATGDKFFSDERGHFWFCGRSDDMLKVSGLWVSPLEVETALLESPAVLECAVVGASDHDGLTKPKAFVVLKDSLPSSQLQAEIFQFLQNKLPKYKLPQWIVFAETLPRTTTGKIQRFKLREANTR